MKENFRIALLGRDFDWSGGVEFLRYIVNGLLAKQPACNLKIYLLLPTENKIETPADVFHIAKCSIKGSLQRKRPWFAYPRPAYHQPMLNFFEQIQKGCIQIVNHESSNSGLLRCLRRIKADVVLPANGSLGRDFLVPWVGYAFDFQHKCLPENFSTSERSDRDAHFNAIFRDATVAIVNSNSVKNDVLRFYPETKTKIYTLPFSPNPILEWFEDLSYDVLEKYSLPDKYFMISNQFWIHKDHRTAFKAIGPVAANMVCTGHMGDYRRPGYIEEIDKFLADNDLKERVKLLGHIPKREQIEIMKKAIAVIQPTLFEGGPGGGSVYDAVSLGVPVILSDIPVNKEVAAKNVWFFRAGDSMDLVDKMRRVIQSEILKPEKERLIKIGQENLERLGDCLLEVISCAVDD